MLVVLILSLLYHSGNCNKLSPYQYSDELSKPKLASCAEAILKKYFSEGKSISYFNVNFKDDHLLNRINSLEILSVSIRSPTRSATGHNSAYMIVSHDSDEFTNYIKLISMERSWEPSVRFLILIDVLHEAELEKVFNILLQLHIYNVIVANGTETTELYSYNPFENYACGKYYDRIIELGQCTNVQSVDLYPNKIVTGLRNCFFNVSCPHWPPFSIDPKQSNDKPFILGTEQYVFNLISEIENFKYNFSYNYDAEMFSRVSQNMSVSGPMSMIQTNCTDVMLGGLILNQARAMKFFYLHGHLDQIDEIRVLVKKSTTTPSWKYVYLGFSLLVWILLLISLVLFTSMIMILTRVRDISHVILILMDYLFLHGSKMQARLMVNIVFICWVWFAFFINSFYQSSLVSLTARPGLDYQIHNKKDLKTYGFKACISNVMQEFMNGESTIAGTFHNDTDEKSCTKLITSIRTVSQSDDRFTITLYGIYLYHHDQFKNEYGEPKIYSFRRPFHKVVYAMYFYKGFPMRERLHMLALRIRETGLTDINVKHHFFSRTLKHHYHSRCWESRYAIPWHVYILGVILSSLTFLLEILSKNIIRKFK